MTSTRDETILIPRQHVVASGVCPCPTYSAWLYSVNSSRLDETQFTFWKGALRMLYSSNLSQHRNTTHSDRTQGCKFLAWTSGICRSTLPTFHRTRSILPCFVRYHEGAPVYSKPLWKPPIKSNSQFIFVYKECISLLWHAQPHEGSGRNTWESSAGLVQL